MLRLMLNQMRSHKTFAICHNAALILLGLALLGGRCFAQEQFDSAGEAQLVELLNQERVCEGLQPLAVDERLTQAARKHTAQMVKHQALSHRFDGEESQEMRSVDENLRSDRVAENSRSRWMWPAPTPT